MELQPTTDKGRRLPDIESPKPQFVYLEQTTPLPTQAELGRKRQMQRLLRSLPIHKKASQRTRKHAT